MSQTQKALIAIIIAICSLQYGSSLAKSLFPVLGVAGAATARLIIAAVVMLLVWRPWKSLSKDKKTLTPIVLYGASLGLMNLLFYFSIERIPLGVAVALEFTGPLTIALLNSRQKLDKLWVLLAVLGITLLIPLQYILPIEGIQQTLDPIGLVLALAAGVFWASYIHFGKKAITNQSEGMVASLGMLVAAIVILPFGIIFFNSSTFSFNILPLAVLVALLSSIIPYSFEIIALKNLSKKTFGILMSLEPAWAALMGFIFLKENLSYKESLAILFIITASIGSTYFESYPLKKYKK